MSQAPHTEPAKGTIAGKPVPGNQSVAPAASGRIGIFRRVAVERYNSQLESDKPEYLARSKRWVLPVGTMLLAAAALLLFA